MVLDPFFGTGTTGAVARKLGRHFIGIERDKDYAKLARSRIADVEPADGEAIETTKSKRAEPRIPFGWVVERGLLPPGTVLQGQQKNHRAKVRADGTLVCADATGSIHRIGAACAGARRLQRLDLLAVRAQRKTGADRRVCVSACGRIWPERRLRHDLAHHRGQCGV